MGVQYTIDLSRTGRPFPHYWETCVGSCHAATVLREDVREHIRQAHRDIGFRYLRFHGLFDDDMSVVIEPMMGIGDVKYAFFNIDSILDFLLDTGMKPFLELGFMPEALASGTQTCMHYKGNVTLPKSYEAWGDLIRTFAGHLLERYGEEEVSQWFFEVWNEPNLSFFFAGTQADYFRLYQVTAEALKSVSPRLRVGGPATSNNAWIPEFIAFCRGTGAPLDFITTHHYPSDDPFATFGGSNDEQASGPVMPSMEELKKLTPEELAELAAAFGDPRNNKNPRDVLRKMTVKAREEAGDYPLYYTEWNASVEYDTSYQAAAIVQTLAYNEGMVEGYSYWTVSDIFEEMGMDATPFKDVFGLQTIHGIKKPVYRAFQMLHEAGDIRLQVEGEPHRTAEVLALSDGSRIDVFVYNHDIVRRDIAPQEISLCLRGRPVRCIRKAVIDETHTNPFRVWQEMNSPQYPTREQLQILKDASELCFETLDDAKGEQVELNFTADCESVTIFRITC